LICDTPIPFEFRRILLENRTGLLRVSARGKEKKMYFRDGDLVFSDSEFFDEKLGVILNLIGKVSDSQYDNISGLIHSADEQVGAILVQNGIISDGDLREARMYRMKRIAASSFSLVSGEASFTEGVSSEKGDTGIRIPLEEIICSGGKRLESVNCVSKRYHFNSPVIREGMEKQYKYLSVEERELVETVRNSDGLSNPRLISRSGMKGDRYWQGIAVLYLLGVVDFDPEITDKPSEEEIVGLVRLKNSLEEEETDIYSLMGVSEDETLAGVQRAYIDLTQRYDPERFGSDISPEIRKSAEFVARELEKAFSEVKGIGDEVFDPGEPESPPETPPEDLHEDSSRPDLLPEEVVKDEFDFDEFYDKFEKGKELYLSNKFDEALKHLKDAVKLGGAKYESLLYLGKCQIHLPFFTDEAERNLKKAIELAPAKSDPVHALGHLYLKLKKKKSAKKCFERAVALEPGNIAAAQDLFRLRFPPRKKKKFFSR